MSTRKYSLLILLISSPPLFGAATELTPHDDAALIEQEYAPIATAIAWAMKTDMGETSVNRYFPESYDKYAKDEQLLKACEETNLKRVRRLLEEGADPNAVAHFERDSQTALSITFFPFSCGCVVLQAFHDKDPFDPESNSTAQDMLSQVDAGTINILDKHVAAIVSLLLEHRVTPEIPSSFTRHGAYLERAFFPCIHRAIELLLKAGANPNDRELFSKYIRREDLEGTKLLLSYGADPNQELIDDDNSCTLKALCAKNNPAVFQQFFDLLVAYGAEPKKKFSSFLLSPEEDHPAGENYELRRSRLFKEKDGSLLFFAACQHNITAVETFLAWGADPEDPNRTGVTPIHFAASRVHTDQRDAQILEKLLYASMHYGG